MSNHHAWLKQLEKLAAIAKLKAKNLAARTESDRLSKEVAALTDEELKSHYDKAMEDIRNAPNLDLEGLTTKEIIEKYTQLCQEKSNEP